MLNQRICGTLGTITYNVDDVVHFESYTYGIAKAQYIVKNYYYANYIEFKNIDTIRDKKLKINIKNLLTDYKINKLTLLLTSNSWGPTSTILTVSSFALKPQEHKEILLDMSSDDIKNKFDSYSGRIRITVADKDKGNFNHKIEYAYTIEEIKDTDDTFENAYISYAEKALTAKNCDNVKYAQSAGSVPSIMENLFSKNLIDCSNADLIQNNAVLNTDGSTRDSEGNVVITIPIPDITKTYEFFTVNNSMYYSQYTRVIMYDEDMNFLGILINNKVELIKITNDKCKYIKVYCADKRNINKNFAMLLETDVILGTATWVDYYNNQYIKKEFISSESINMNINRADIITLWRDKNVVFYGDSITAQGNSGSGGYPLYTDALLLFDNKYVRGVGGQTFKWNDGGYYCKKNGDGGYVNRYKSKNGTISSANGQTNIGFTTDEEKKAIESTLGYEIEIHRGCFCSWDRITSMIPESIRNSIDAVIVMGGTNDHSAVEETASDGNVNGSLEWSASNKTDTDWVADAKYYNGGDFDITSFKGAIASTIMKMHIWCPNAIIIIATPFTRWDTSTNAQYKNKNGVTLKDVSDIEIDVARYMDTPYINSNDNNGITAWNYNTFTTDGVHPNVEGQKRLGRSIASGMNTIFPLIR